MKIEFVFNIGDPVIVTQIGRPGRVQALTKNHNGEQYQIIYWAGGKRSVEWLYDWELKAAAAAGEDDV